VRSSRLVIPRDSRRTGLTEKKKRPVRSRHGPLRPPDPRRPAPPAGEQAGQLRLALRRRDPARLRGVVPAQDRERAAEGGQRDGQRAEEGAHCQSGRHGPVRVGRVRQGLRTRAGKTDYPEFRTGVRAIVDWLFIRVQNSKRRCSWFICRSFLVRDRAFCTGTSLLEGITRPSCVCAPSRRARVSTMGCLLFRLAPNQCNGRATTLQRATTLYQVPCALGTGDPLYSEPIIP
jgi:hypothetical protein